MTERTRPFGCEPKGQGATKTERALKVAESHQDNKQLVSITHREAMTTSRIIADVFGKKHQHVMEAIRKVECPESFSLSNFRPSEYVDDRGKRQPMVEVTRDGFTFIAMGFTGKRAALFKVKFIEAFNRLEQTLLNQSNLSWLQGRKTGKIARRAETDVIQRFVQYATRQGAESASWYYASITMLTNQGLFGVKVANRNTLDPMQLSFLTVAEQVVGQTLEAGMEAGMHHKVIYQAVQRKVFAFVAALPPQRQISA